MTVIASADIQHDLVPAPIDPSWIVGKPPVTRNRVLFHASDKSAWTMLWDCTAGEFNWRYSFDETIHFLEGEVTITLPGGSPRRFAAGDVIFFPAGVVANWKIDTYIRKLAFCQTPAPAVMHLPLRLARRVARQLGKVAGLFSGLPVKPAAPDRQAAARRPAYIRQRT